MLFNTPKNGDALMGRELGGYPISKEQLLAFGEPFGTLSRSEVLAYENAAAKARGLKRGRFGGGEPPRC
jgi:hypothetical protein